MHVSLAQLLVRHWRVTVPLLAVTGVACVLIELSAAPAYRAVGSLMLATPAHDPSRMLESTEQLDAAIGQMEGTDVRDAVSHGDAELSLHLANATTLVFMASASDADDAEATIEAAVDRFERELEDRQILARIPSDDHLIGRLLTPSVEARETDDGRHLADAVVWVDGLTGQEGNPYEATHTTARLIALALSGTDGSGVIESRIDRSVRYRLVLDPWGDVPTVGVVTEGADGSAVVAAFDAISAVMDLELNGRQSRAQVPLARRIFFDVLARPTTATDTSPIVQPATALVGLVGTGAAGAAAGLRRRSTSRDRPEDVPDGHLLARELIARITHRPERV